MANQNVKKHSKEQSTIFMSKIHAVQSTLIKDIPSSLYQVAERLKTLWRKYTLEIEDERAHAEGVYERQGPRT